MRAVGIILSEAERMAGIVKKIGKITKYETTDYVGSARMLDLDRAAASDDSEPAIALPDDAEGAIPQIPADESQTGEFHAVKPGTERAMHPSLAELTELDQRKGDKP